jgi:mannose-6-phosphate isomerase
MRDVLLFDPIYQERVWGGRALETELGRTLPAARPIGESWEIVDRPEAQSRVRGGSWAGATLREVLADHAAQVMGPGWTAGARFPLLVKWLDCRERLSLQVHPPAAVAAALGGEPKTENWYVARAEPGARLIIGLNPGVSPERLERAIGDGTAEAWVRGVPVAPGDSILVRSGQVHAIDAGNLILEIQQNSDTTYRLYDWGRTGLDGRPRPLHVAESLRSILWGEDPPQVVRASRESGILAKCPEFSIRRVVLRPGESLSIAAGEQPRLLSVVEGGLAGPGCRMERGDNALLPWAAELTATAARGATVLVTEGFA